MALRDGELQGDQVDTGYGLGDGVLHLQSGVHLQEPEAAVAVQQELHRACTFVSDSAGCSHGSGFHAHPQVAIDSGGRRFLEHLLVATLQGAVALVECDHVAVAVGQYLDLHVASTLQVALDEHRGVAEGGQRFTLGTRNGVGQLIGATHDAHPAPSAPR